MLTNCRNCGDPTDYDLCEHCMLQVFDKNEMVCQVCGGLFDANGDDNICDDCAEKIAREIGFWFGLSDE